LASICFARADVAYERDIAPIFRTYCAGCHNDADREGEFSLETFAGLRTGGDKGDPLNPGNAGASLLIKLIEGRAKPVMPPKDEPKVPAAELAQLKEWIAAGAPGPKRDFSILEQLVVPQVATAKQQAAPITALAFSQDGKQLAVAAGGRVELRRSPNGRARKTLAGLPGKVNAVHFSPDGKQLVAAGGIPGLNGAASLWEVRSGKRVREFAGHRDTLFDAEFSPDGSLLATAGYDRAIRLWQVADGKLLRTIAGHNGAVFDLAFDLSGTVLASASADQTVKLWRVADGLRLDTLNQPQGELNAVIFTPDGRHILAAGADKRIHLWRFVSTNAPALNPVAESRFAHEAAITAFTLSADGKSLLTAAADRTLKQWSLPDLVERRSFETQPDLVSALAAMPQRERFAAARLDGSLKVYDLQPPTVARSAGLRPGVKRPASPAGSETGAPVVTAEPVRLAEAEPNDLVTKAQAVNVPAEVTGSISRAGDADVFRFRAEAGQELMLAINAAAAKSSLDSRLEVLTTDGQPVEQVVLQAVRDSWFTFRGKDSDTPDDFRLQNWREMELNEFFYANGEVVRLWLYPRGPDSGFKVYPGEGRRHTFFGTTALTHALNEPGYIVVPHPAGSQPVPNGLPVFRLNFENDDDPTREAGVDSRLLFTAPKTAEFLVRVTDTRGSGGATNFHFTLAVRPSRPDFSVTVEGMNPKVSPGSGRELRFVAKRREGFTGPIRIDIANLPPGFTASTPVEIEAGQLAAVATLHAEPAVSSPDDTADKAVKVTAVATIRGREVRHELGSLGDLQVGKPPRLTVEILAGNDRAHVRETPGQPLEFTIRPGETITARVRAVRHDFKDRIELGGEDSGRNLPHGLYVDNIGLNGLLIVEGQTERDFFITAAPMAPPGVRQFHLRARGDDGQVSRPAVIRVLPAVNERQPASGR
jgi:dipeptidyl aminopeptidase/acylaminoacyl peptidase